MFGNGPGWGMPGGTSNDHFFRAPSQPLGGFGGNPGGSFPTPPPPPPPSSGMHSNRPSNPYSYVKGSIDEFSSPSQPLPPPPSGGGLIIDRSSSVGHSMMNGHEGDAGGVEKDLNAVYAEFLDELGENRDYSLQRRSRDRLLTFFIVFLSPGPCCLDRKKGIESG